MKLVEESSEKEKVNIILGIVNYFKLQKVLDQLHFKVEVGTYSVLLILKNTVIPLISSCVGE